MDGRNKRKNLSLLLQADLPRSRDFFERSGGGGLEMEARNRLRRREAGRNSLGDAGASLQLVDSHLLLRRQGWAPRTALRPEWKVTRPSASSSGTDSCALPFERS